MDLNKKIKPFQIRKGMGVYVIFTFSLILTVSEIIVYKSLKQEEKSIEKIFQEINQIKTDANSIKSISENLRNIIHDGYFCENKELCIEQIFSFLETLSDKFEIKSLEEDGIKKEENQNTEKNSLVCVKFSLQKSNINIDDIQNVFSLLFSKEYMLEYSNININLKEAAIDAQGRVCKIAK